jgi:hypothetical protein
MYTPSKPATILSLSLIAATIGSGIAIAESRIEVTITNITSNQTFTPVMVASHRGDIDLFESGTAASDELIAIAESGNVAPMTNLLESNDKLCISIPGPYCGGEGISDTDIGEGYIHISRGIGGIGSLLPAASFDWRNNVPKITVRHVNDK